MKNKIYIPQQVETLIQGLDFKRKDDLRIICDMVYRRQIYFKSELQKKIWVYRDTKNCLSESNWLSKIS